MKMKKILTAFCLAAGLAVAVPAVTSTFGISQTMSVVHAADGWSSDSGGWYYLKNNAKLTGFQEIDGSVYYFNGNGYRVTGLAKISGKYYYFGTDGKRVTGPVKVKNATFYFSPATGALYTGVKGMYKSPNEENTYYYFSSAKNGVLHTNRWVKHNGKWFYADATGRVKLGTIKVGTKLYHITTSGRLTSYKMSSFDKKYYYASAKGVLKTGVQKINGKLYYFSPTTGQRMSGTITSGKYTYFFSSKGYAATGWLRYGTNYCYFDKNGRRVSGLQTIGGKRYYFDPSNNDFRVTNSWKKIGNYYYYFNAKGIAQTGFFKVGNDTYYANSKGIRLRGWQTIGGRKYYFSLSNGKMLTGWVRQSGKRVYLNANKSSSTYGAASTGLTKIDGSWYYFNQKGFMKTGWVQISLKKYYFDKSTGKMLTGRQKIDGKWYNFGTSGAITVSANGSWVIKVNRKKNFVVVYKGNVEIKAFVCSTAANVTNTPTGTFTLRDKLYWHELNGPSWGQYCSHITDDILFHSVPCRNYNDPYSLKVDAYNQLGKSASGGCIRLTVEHAKWLFDNCPQYTTKVVISDSISKPTTIEIEQAQKITNYSKTYDPTDTFQNPYSVR